MATTSMLNEVAWRTKSLTAQKLLVAEHAESLTGNQWLKPEVADMIVASDPSADILKRLVRNPVVHSCDSFEKLVHSKLASVRAEVLKYFPKNPLVIEGLLSRKKLSATERTAAWSVYDSLTPDVRKHLAMVGSSDFACAWVLDESGLTHSQALALFEGKKFDTSRRQSQMVPAVLRRFPSLFPQFFESNPSAAAGSFAASQYCELVEEKANEWLEDSYKNLYPLIAIIANPALPPKLSNRLSALQGLNYETSWYRLRDETTYQVGSDASDTTEVVAKAILRRAAKDMYESSERYQVIRLTDVPDVLKGGKVSNQDVANFYTRLLENIEYNAAICSPFNLDLLQEILPLLDGYRVNTDKLSQFLSSPDATPKWSPSFTPDFYYEDVCESCTNEISVKHTWGNQWSNHLHFLEDRFQEDEQMWRTALGWMPDYAGAMQDLTEQVELIHS